MAIPSRRPIEIHGHRGARGLVPENTMASFEHAFATGVQSVELDVGCTIDDELVIFHDFTLNPDLVRNASGQFLERRDITLRSCTLTQLQQYDVGQMRPDSDYAARFPSQVPLEHARIPTLKEVIEWLGTLPGNPYLTIEIKSTPDDTSLCVPPSLAARRLVDLLEQLAVPVERDLITSFDWRVLACVQELEPELRTSYLTVQQPGDDTIGTTRDGASEWTGDLVSRDYDGRVAAMVNDAGGNGWSPYYKDINAELVEDAHAQGLMVSVWTVNEPDDIDRMIACGVDVIITDYPQRVRDRLHAQGLELPPPLTA